MDLQLRPVMTWKTRIIQVKNLDVGDTVGYGRTYEVMRPTRTAVLPVGYYNGYSRALTGRAYVLVNGKRAAVVGRVMMNMMIIDVTDIPDAKVGTTVVLLGRSGDQRLTAERMAGWMDTIHYEVVTGVEKSGRRIIVDGGS
jgi:alanine racemase